MPTMLIDSVPNARSGPLRRYAAGRAAVSEEAPSVDVAGKSLTQRILEVRIVGSEVYHSRRRARTVRGPHHWPGPRPDLSRPFLRKPKLAALVAPWPVRALSISLSSSPAFFLAFCPSVLLLLLFFFHQTL